MLIDFDYRVLYKLFSQSNPHLLVSSFCIFMDSCYNQFLGYNQFYGLLHLILPIVFSGHWPICCSFVFCNIFCSLFFLAMTISTFQMEFVGHLAAGYIFVLIFCKLCGLLRFSFSFRFVYLLFLLRIAWLISGLENR